MLLAFREFGTLDFLDIARRAAEMSPEVTFGMVSLMTLLFFIGATGKSAQIPLYVWLPDAMEGPTPVSALIHAATMVTAGVYMIGRNAELFSLAPITMQTVAVVGAATALMAGTIGLVQNDIKRVLAYSTVSQLGYMFLAMGVGAFSAGIFHLYTHAFFKALMFLGSGAVIHALHGEQDMRHMGGLKNDLPITFWTFLVGTLAIAGVPGLAGFFSKDEILFYTFYNGHRALWVVGILTALLTATYMFRLLYMTFYGERRDAAAAGQAHGHADAHGGHGHADAHGRGGGHLHDAPPAMAVVLVVLAVGSLLAGYVGVPHALFGSNRIETFLEPSFHPAAHASPQLDPGIAAGHDEATVATAHAEAATQAGHEVDHDEGRTQLELSLMAVSIAVALLGIGIATFSFKSDPSRAARMAASLPGVHRLLLNKYYVDEAYDAAIVQPIKIASEKVLWKVVDAGAIDGVVNGTGGLVRGGAAVLRLLQTGSVRAYAASLFIGVIFVLAYFLIR
jgi:NADH-quinone oxidoreductase subunit L